MQLLTFETKRPDTECCMHTLTAGNAASAESSSLCREPKLKLTTQGRFAESTRSSSRHRKNPRYRESVPRGNRAGSRHSHALTARRHYGESCRSMPSAQPRPHGTTERPWWPLAWPSNVPRAQPLALDKEFCAECFFKTLGKELKIFKFTHPNLLLHQPTHLQSICSNFT
jgi:hypothetical protein